MQNAAECRDPVFGAGRHIHGTYCHRDRSTLQDAAKVRPGYLGFDELEQLLPESLADFEFRMGSTYFGILLNKGWEA